MLDLLTALLLVRFVSFGVKVIFFAFTYIGIPCLTLLLLYLFLTGIWHVLKRTIPKSF